MLENTNIRFIFCFNEVNMLKDIRGAPQLASGPTPSRKAYAPEGIMETHSLKVCFSDFLRD